MRSFLVIALAASIFLSCNKSNDENIPTGNVYIENFTRIGLEYFDEVNNEADTSINHYQYFSDKIVHKSIYKSAGDVDSSQYSIYYDPSGNIVRYENDFYWGDTNGEVQRIIFTYANGKVSEARATFFGGDVSIQQFDYSTDGRRIIVYDTLPSSTPFEEYSEYRYYFSNDNKLDSQILVDPYGSEKTAFQYDALGNVSLIGDDYSATTFTSRENRGIEVYNTYSKIIGNMWYHFFMNVNINDPLVFNNATESLFSINSKYPASSVILNTQPYSINNVFENNKLTSQVLPNGIGSKSYGPSKFSFTYINVP